MPSLRWFLDRKHRLPRVWSNDVLREIAPSCRGDVINVSAWRDEDKEGGHYRDYFSNAETYTVSNWRSEARGLQGDEGELFLDLEQPLAFELNGRFDVVFNHTTLEHVFDIQTAFRNLCALSRDLVILVVPFLQEMHGEYGDYWRISPLAIRRLFERSGFTMLRCDFNDHPRASVYLVAVASKDPERWAHIRRETKTASPRLLLDGADGMVGCRAVPNPILVRLASAISTKLMQSWRT